MSKDSFIEIRDLIKIYHSKETNIHVPALRSIELDVKKGEFISIIGPSGSGKTTLLLILAGMASVSSGTVRVDNLRLDQFNDQDRTEYRRKKVGTLWQLPSRNLIYEISILENVEIPMRLLGFPREARITRAQELLKEVGLGNRMHHKPIQLSGGQVQRAGLATALAHNPSLLLADEPTGELDSVTTEEVMNYFKTLNKEYGITAIMVTHEMEVARTSDRLIQIVDGRISGYMPTEKIKRLEDLNHVYIDTYGSIQLPKHIITSLKLQRDIRIIKGDNKLTLVQDDQ